MKKDYLKGRGAQLKVHNRFFKHESIIEDDFLNYCAKENEAASSNSTQYIEVHPKSILNKVTSTDIGLAYSMNPYQGCEHGCIYCYARNSHEYWGYGAGIDFETKVLFKRNASKLLENKLSSQNWKAKNIMLSGNTDCYQPIEKKLKITRGLLKVFLNFKHPVSIITKNALVLRDLDLLKELSSLNLVHVCISLTSLNEKTRRILEPRTASVAKRLKTIHTLAEHKIPVNVMMAPIIPSLNSHEIFELLKTASEKGACSAAYTIIRLNGALGKIFSDWLIKALPDKADKILNQIASCHGGKLNDSRPGIRMKGEGALADQVNQQFRLAKKLYFKDKSMPPLDYSLYDRNYFQGQYRLF